MDILLSTILHAMILLLVNSTQRELSMTSVTMNTQGQVFVLSSGHTILLDCVFISENFSLFDNPIIWKKFQRHEEMPINVMGNILPPFIETNRFDVTFHEDSISHWFSLRIINLSLEDSGNYTCEVRGRHSVVMATVTHYIFVRASVQQVVLQSDNTSLELATPRRLTFTDGVTRSLRCLSLGGYPPPDIAIYINNNDLTSQFVRTHTATMHGVKGLRRMLYQTERSTDRLTIETTADGSLVRCVVTVPGLAPVVSHAIIEVQYAPVIQCQRAEALAGERNVHLDCEVKSKPGLTALFWIIDVNGTTVTEGEIVSEYWTLVRDRGDGWLDSKLFMRQVMASSFRTYALVAENNVAVTTRQLHLYTKYKRSHYVTSTTTWVAVEEEVTLEVAPNYPSHTFTGQSRSSGNATFYARWHHMMCHVTLAKVIVVLWLTVTLNSTRHR